VHERLRKLVALAVFSSDAISSTAYGTEQIMLIPIAGGAVATRLAFPTHWRQAQPARHPDRRSCLAPGHLGLLTHRHPI
jgi:hypothetical protein